LHKHANKNFAAMAVTIHAMSDHVGIWQFLAVRQRAHLRRRWKILVSRTFSWSWGTQVLHTGFLSDNSLHNLTLVFANFQLYIGRYWIG